MRATWNQKNKQPSPHMILVGASGSGKSFATYQMTHTKFQEIATKHGLELSSLCFFLNNEERSLDEVRTILTFESNEETTFTIQVKHKDVTLESFMIHVSPAQLITPVMMAASSYPKDEQMSDMIDHIKEIVGINMTKEQLRALLNKNPWLNEQLKKYSFQDTVVRESVSDMIAETFIGEQWPMNGDNITDKEFEEFCQNIRTAAAQQGYQVVEF